MEETETKILSRKEKRKLAKKKKRKEKRKEMAEKTGEEEEAEEERKLEAIIREAEEERERALKEFNERERLWLQAMELKNKKEREEEEEEERRKALEEEEAKRQLQVQKESECDEDDEWEYVEEGPAEIIWQGNEIIIKKKKVRVPRKESNQLMSGKEVNYTRNTNKDVDRPTSNPLPPQSEAFIDYKSAQQALESVARQVPNFGTEQDKAHCPFHLKTGACRFGQSCSRVHFYPDKSCTLLIKNMYNGPGLAWEQDEGLEHTDEEVEHSYEEFYEDVHTEFLKFGEIVNFKVCKNGSFHLRGNVYVQYKSLESAVLAYQSINGRYFAGKQVKCEFVNVTRWKVAICGEYMKSRFKSCSHGTACNFIHCFRNPGGDYEWADWDKPAPKFWVKKMAALFGYFNEYGYEKQADQDNLGPRKNSNKFTADSDRHRSRRSRSREIDCVKSGSGRSRDDEDDLWESTHNRRSNNDNRKRIKLLDEKLHKESPKFKDRQDSESRSDEIHSDGSWLDRDRDKDRDRHQGHRRKSTQRGKSTDYGDSKRTHEADSNGNGLVKHRDTPLHHAQTKKSLRYSETRELKDDNGDHKNRGNEAHVDQQNWDKDGKREFSYLGKRSRDRSKVPYLDNHEESKKRNDAESSGDWSDGDGDRDKDRHKSHERKSLGHWSKVLKFQDGHSVGKHRSCDTDSGDDWLDIDKETHHGHRRKRSQYQTEETKFSDDQGESAHKLKENFHNGESYSERLNHRRGKTHKRSSKRSLSGREHTKPDYMHSKSNEGHESSSPLQSDERVVNISNDSWEPSTLEEHPNFSRQITGVESSESSSPGRYNGRSKSQDLVSKYCYDDKIDDHRWDSNEDAYEEHHNSRSKSTCDDKNQFSDKSNSDDHSRELYNERRSRSSSQSSRERYPKFMTGSDEEYHEYKKNYRSHNVAHRSHGHRRHDK